QLGELSTLIDVAARDRTAFGVVMLDNRRDEGSRATAAIRVERMRTFHDAPAEVVARLDEQDHLPKILPNVAYPRLAGKRIEAEAPRIAKAVGIDFRARIRNTDEWVVLWDRVVAAGVRVIDVEAHHDSEQVVQALPRALGIGTAGAVASSDVKVAVRTDDGL